MTLTSEQFKSVGGSPSYYQVNGRLRQVAYDAKLQGLTSIGIAEIMSNRLDASNDSEWWQKEIISGDVIAYHPSGKAKILLNPMIPEDFFSKRRAYGGAIRLPAKFYQHLEGREFRLEELSQSTFPLEGIADNGLWRIVSGNRNLLKDYAQRVAEHRGESPFMQVWLAKHAAVPVIRYISIGALWQSSPLNCNANMNAEQFFVLKDDAHRPNEPEYY